MKKLFTALAIALLGLCATAETSVQALTLGENHLIGGPGKVLQIEAQSAADVSGTVSVKRIVDIWTYSSVSNDVPFRTTIVPTLTNFTETVATTNVEPKFVTVTNLVETAPGVTNRYTRSHVFQGEYLTNVVTVTRTRPLWITSVTTNFVGRFKDVVSHTVTTNDVGTLTVTSGAGALTPASDLFFTGGDVLLLETELDEPIAFRLYSEE